MLIYEEILRIEVIFENLYADFGKYEKASKIKGCRGFGDV